MPQMPVFSKLAHAARLAAAPAFLCALAIALLPAISLALQPQPDPVPRRWQLHIEPGPLRLATVNVPDTGPRAFFYFTYKVVNNSGQDLLFAPAFELANDRGMLRRAGRDVPLTVTRELMRRTENPFIEDQIAIIDQLLQGEENAKFGIVIWPADDFRAEEATIYAAGFSGETATVTNPDTGETVTLRKTLMLRHTAPGTLVGQGHRPLTRTERRWIMR